MSTLEALARALAVEREIAQPLTVCRHVHIGQQPLVFIPLAMAGEANAPLAALIGPAGRKPRLLTVAEPRDRDQRFAFAAELATILLGYLETSEDPQLVVPNPAAVTFTRMLGRSTRLRRTTGEWAVKPQVPIAGRWLTFLADRADYPGSSLMLPMTEVLRQHWATGQSDLEDANLAAILAWIAPPAGIRASEAARQAEDPLTSPPAGPATDPTFDNEILEPRMRALRAAALTGDGRTYDRAKAAFDDALATQLTPTWRLIERAVAELRRMPEAAHVAQRRSADHEAVTWHKEHIRGGGPPQARRDGAVAAARRLASMERIQQMVSAQRAFDDPLVMAEYRMLGDAFAGRVVAAHLDRTVPTGKRRVLRPHITVATDDVLRLDDGVKELTSPSRPSQKAVIVSVHDNQVTLELSGGMGRRLTPEPGSVPQVGDLVCYATFSDEFHAPPAFPEPDQTPWTHGGPPQPYLPADDDAREAWS